MGIPAYFSHIIKNYPNILQKFQKQLQVNHLYIDSNSIVYDSIRQLEYNGNDDAFERKLINAVCQNIETYIQQISPSHLVYIAFDGVAPVAKLNQQKNRRYKSWFMADYNKDNSSDNNSKVTSPSTWNSTAITPGTEFMNKLNLQVQYHFRIPTNHNVKQIIVSGSNLPGEGEHKIFEYIRDNENMLKNMKTVARPKPEKHRWAREKTYSPGKNPKNKK